MSLQQILFLKLAGNKAQVLNSDEVIEKWGEIQSFDAFYDVEDGKQFSCFAKVGRTGFTPHFDTIKLVEEQPEEEMEWFKYGNVWISPEEREIFDAIEAMTSNLECVNVTCVGKSGFGKTSRAYALADRLGYDLVTVDVGSIQTMRDWWYTREVADGETVVRLTELAEKLPQGRLVVLFDDNNRANPALHNSLMPILDFRRAVKIMHEHIVVGPSVVFIQTLNEGFGFVGTQTLDLAFINRFDITLEVVAPPREIEREIILDRYSLNGEAEEIVDLLAEMRLVPTITDAVDVSTRSALKIARLVYYDVPIGTAFRNCLANGTQDEVYKAIEDVLKDI